MALGGLGLFLLEAGAGTALLLLLFPVGTLGKGFFSLHGSLAFAFLLAACLVRPPGLPLLAAASAAAMLGLSALVAHADWRLAGRSLLATGAALSLWALARFALQAPRGEGDVWTVAGAVAGGLFFGAVLLTMNLGHWYLISRSLPWRLLSRGAALFAALAAVRTLLLLLALAADRSASGRGALFSLEQDALFFLFRVTWGIVGPLALSYFILRTAHMRSNQAATGLLYVALLFVLIGELLSAYLTVSTGFPA